MKSSADGPFNPKLKYLSLLSVLDLPPVGRPMYMPGVGVCARLVIEKSTRIFFPSSSVPFISRLALTAKSFLYNLIKEKKIFSSKIQPLNKIFKLFNFLKGKKVYQKIHQFSDKTPNNIF